MTLAQQLRYIAKSWFHPEFAKFPITRIIPALAMEAFKRAMEWGDLEGSNENENLVIYEAIKLYDNGTFTEDLPGVAGFSHCDDDKQCECH